MKLTNVLSIIARVRKPISVALWLLFLSFAVAQPNKDNASLVADLQKRLSLVQPWSITTNYATADWNQLAAVAVILQTNSPTLVEQTLFKLQHSFETDEASRTLSRAEFNSKLYLMLRMMFQLPEHGNMDDWPAAGGWLTRGSERNKDGTANLGWPIKWEANLPSLISGFGGYEGFPYDAATDYRNLKMKYRMRDLLQVKSKLK